MTADESVLGPRPPAEDVSGTSGASANPPWWIGRRVLLGVLVMLAFALATNQWGQEIGPDAQTYEDIADAAPGFPDFGIGSAFAERFASPWVAGTLGEVLPGGSRTGLWVIVVICVITMLVLLISICSHLRLGSASTLLCVGLLALNPYVLRLFVNDPGPVDPVFATGIAIVIWALVTQRLGFVLIGSLVALLGRQSALLAVPAAMTWVYFGEGWRSRPQRSRLLIAGGMVAGVVVGYALIKAAASSFSYPFAPSIPGDTILPVIGDPGSISDLVGQAARVAAPLAPVAGCLIGAMLGLIRAGERVRLPAEFWCALLIGAAIIVQPLLISPDFHGYEGNQGRLSALGVFPFCVALVYALRLAGERLERAPWWALAGGGAALLAASLNDKFTTIGPQTNAQFVAVEVVAAAVLAGLLVFALGAAKNLSR